MKSAIRFSLLTSVALFSGALWLEAQTQQQALGRTRSNGDATDQIRIVIKVKKTLGAASECAGETGGSTRERPGRIELFESSEARSR